MAINPVNAAALQQLLNQQQRWAEFPGSAPGGTGLTGLASNDAQGWSNLQNANIAAVNTERAMSGAAPLQTNVRPDNNPLGPSIADNPNWWLPPGAPAVTGPGDMGQFQQNLDMMPAAIRGLYASQYAKTFPTQPKTEQ